MKEFLSPAVFSIALTFSVVANAVLSGRDLDGNLATFEAYYDSVQDITWLADANYAQTSSYDADGRMTWAAANAWADSLALGGYNDWRLPNTVDVGNDGATVIRIFEGVDYGYNITAHSDMSHLYYETLRNFPYFDTAGNAAQPGWGQIKTGPFSNLQPFLYWSATGFASHTPNAWVFDFYYGNQYSGNKTAGSFYAWAVHTGDVGASAVPLPTAAWLFGSAMLGLALSREK